ncbi:multicopper oxidase family protein [Rhodococcus triatomae]|nr:multicopper oxidase type 2 [Rhodococcus triatomae BKS 15-14]
MSGHISRRRLLGAAALGAAAPLLLRSGISAQPTGGPPPFVPPRGHDQPSIPGIQVFSYRSPELERFVDPLPILPTQAATGTLTAGYALHRFHRDLPPAPSWGFGGVTHLGPVLEARAGEPSEMTFVNDLRTHVLAADIDTTLHGALPIDRTSPPLVVHLHGAPNRPEYDGYPTVPIRPGQSVDMSFGTGMEATTLWYHDHSMGTTRLSMFAGLAAPYLIRDEWDTGRPDNPIGLPAGDHEIPLIICDKLFHPDGRLRYDNTPTVQQGHWAGGLCGDVMVVNGAAWPYLDVDRGTYRFRIVNAGQLNDYRLSLSNRMPFTVIGSDGGLLDEPVQVVEIDIAPAERYDILIDFSPMPSGTTVDLLNSMQISIAGQANGAHMIPDVMRFRVGGKGRTVAPVALRGPELRSELPVVEKPDVTRTITMGVTANPNNLTFLGVLHMNLNNLNFHDEDFDKPVQGTVEQWDLVNADATFQVHSIHLHLIQFRVIGRQDYDKVRYLAENPPPLLGTRWTPSAERYVTGPMQPPAPYETGWKDTVRCPPNQITRIAVRWPTAEELGFDPDAPFTAPDGSTQQGYVWHCHLTDHEDNEMMQRLRIVAPDGAGTDVPSTPHTPGQTGQHRAGPHEAVPPAAVGHAGHH